ncbi:hypothetical protein CYLTODRAFT_494817 [Cylindrobasidium torrendii FP15055 ss-10]|uniref:Uncharacterized protein n=1 Tax=Cylindrobasidium torrendii FP15055 ss-10 TaxID=1314674 RepID=A0A0D7AUZ5_9AGAR|nr:hypothetical protein CYLTODRAFT_494817 [Cylindrobasidium torrendii FP15055 ss-10]
MLFAVLSFILLAALAFNITLGTSVIQASDLLNFPLEGNFASCAANCTTAQTAIDDGGSDATSICSAETASKVLSCQQCLFTSLLAANTLPPDPRMGSQPFLAAYGTSCAADANVTFTAPQTALALPPFWDGPTGIEVPLVGLVFVVGAGAFMGIGAIVLLSNM